MPITNPQSGTRIDEIGEQIYRISTPVPEDVIPHGFTFNQFLLVDDEPLLFHTGLRRMFPLTLEAVRQVMPPEKLRWIAFSHVEADECGALNEWLAVAPQAQPLCGEIAAMVSVQDIADRPPRALRHGEQVSLGKHTVTWLDAPHVPHGMECGYLFEERSRTLFCGDLLSQAGNETPPVTDSDAEVWESSEMLRAAFPYASLRDPAAIVERMAATEPKLLAIMHGASYRGDGARLLRRLSQALARA